ncbi:MAG: Mu-like prophage major head subunit gpT family protein [Chitinophagaceae bacterium]
MATIRANFAVLLTPGFREIFNDKFQEVPMQMDNVFHMNISEKDSEKDSAISGFGLAQQTGEGAPISYEDPVQGYTTTYVHLKYTKGFKISREMYEDDLYGIMKKRPAALGRTMRRTTENQAALVFNNAFNTSYLGGDSKPLLSTVHPRPDGGNSQSNASATGITLSETNIETAIIAMRGQLDDKGQKIDVYPKTLLVPINLRKTAHLIVDSPLRQGTADNDVNYYKSDFSIIDWIYLTSTTAWFLIDPGVHELTWFWRVKPQFKDDELFDTEYAVYKSTMRLSRGWSDWRGVWGSLGDSNAYSN